MVNKGNYPQMALIQGQWNIIITQIYGIPPEIGGVDALGSRLPAGCDRCSRSGDGALMGPYGVLGIEPQLWCFFF